jgi:N-acetylmuramoyl-L-alanine amidase
MVDPGHYAGFNKSNVVPAYCEGDRMWVLAQYLMEELKSYGFTVGCTKPSINSYPKNNGTDYVYGRGYKAKGYDLFISLHSNACNTESVDRVVVIFPMSAAGRDLAVKLGTSAKTVMGVSSYQMMQRDYNTGAYYYDQKARAGKDYYGVIRGAMDAGAKTGIIIEHGFHTNKKCATWLMSDANLKALAKAEAKVIADYYGAKKTTSTTQTTTSTNTTTQNTASAVKEEFKVGDTVLFTGSKHYVSSDAANGSACKPGKAKIKKIYNIGKSKHPYCIQAVSGSGSTVYGWVDAEDIESIVEFKPYIAKVTASVLNVRASADENAKVTTTISKGGVYTIIAEKNGFGQLKSGAGYVSLQYMQKIRNV